MLKYTGFLLHVPVAVRVQHVGGRAHAGQRAASAVVSHVLCCLHYFVWSFEAESLNDLEHSR